MDVISAVVMAGEEAAAEGGQVSPYVYGASAFIILSALLVLTMMIKVGKD